MALIRVVLLSGGELEMKRVVAEDSPLRDGLFPTLGEPFISSFSSLLWDLRHLFTNGQLLC
jgi:hypothetical protein